MRRNIIMDLDEFKELLHNNGVDSFDDIEPVRACEGTCNKCYGTCQWCVNTCTKCQSGGS